MFFCHIRACEKSEQHYDDVFHVLFEGAKDHLTPKVHQLQTVFQNVGTRQFHLKCAKLAKTFVLAPQIQPSNFASDVSISFFILTSTLLF